MGVHRDVAQRHGLGGVPTAHEPKRAGTITVCQQPVDLVEQPVPSAREPPLPFKLQHAGEINGLEPEDGGGTGALAGSGAPHEHSVKFKIQLHLVNNRGSGAKLGFLGKPGVKFPRLLCMSS